MRTIEQTIEMPKTAKFRTKTMDGKYYLYFSHKPKLTVFDTNIGLPTSNHTGWSFADGGSVVLSDTLKYHVPDYDVIHWKKSLVEIFPNEFIQNNSKQDEISFYEEIKAYKKELNIKDKKLSHYKQRIYDFRIKATEKNIKIERLEDELSKIKNKNDNIISEQLLENLATYCVSISENNKQYDTLCKDLTLLQAQLDRTEQHLRSAENALQYKEHVILFLKGEISDGWDRKDY